LPRCGVAHYNHRIPKWNAWVAQLVEQRIENPCVGGSIPSPGTIFNVIIFKPPFSNAPFLFCIMRIILYRSFVITNDIKEVLDAVT
jgi:hypothetical protein